LLLSIASCPLAASLITEFLVVSSEESGTGLISLPSASNFFGGSGAYSGTFETSIFSPCMLAAS
jgi:hypothetical protein